MFLELQDITKYFGGLCVLSDVSFNVDEREIVGLIGPNGAGKTTLFNVITGIYRPNEGLIRYRGSGAKAQQLYIEKPKLNNLSMIRRAKL
jgi:branched-chain amino acid transport system ATP-binding protein